MGCGPLATGWPTTPACPPWSSPPVAGIPLHTPQEGIEELEFAVKTLGLKVIPWTVNNPVEMEKFVAWGVDGIITDYPNRLREVMAANGMRLPKPYTRRR